MDGRRAFDIEQFERAYDSFNAAYEEEDDRSGGRGAARIFKNEGADLIEAAAGHPQWQALRAAVNRADRGALATIAVQMLNRSAA